MREVAICDSCGTRFNVYDIEETDEEGYHERYIRACPVCDNYDEDDTWFTIVEEDGDDE